MPQPDPLVSVILPVRDGESFIGDTLDSALGQTHRNLEVVVVDDGSRDRTRAILDTWAERDSRMRVLSQANRGVAAARNRAIDAARGDLVAPLDADDLWEPTKIERQVRRMTEGGDGVGLVYCWWVWVDVNGRLLDCSPRWCFEGSASEILLQVNYTGNASVPLYRRRYLEQAGGYDVTLRERDAEGCEDLDIALKVAELSHVAVVPSSLVGYRRHRHGMSAQTDRMWRSHALVLDGARRRRPGLPSASVRRSQSQFALYLAGVSFWSRGYARAVGWGWRALRSGLALQVLPSVSRVLLTTSGRRRDGRSPAVIGPGTRFSDWEMPPPLIPYDRIYERRPMRETARR